MRKTALLAALLAAPQETSSPDVLPRVADDASIELSAAWEPCVESMYGLFAETPVLRDARPDRLKEAYGADSFRPFLPAEPVSVGEPWEVDSQAVLPFLRQLSPGAKATFHHGHACVPGTFATLRAVAPDALEILFRAHAEFELEGGVYLTPAQFEGRLVLGRERGELRSFHVELPSRNTNADCNVPIEYDAGDGRKVEGFSADIGWIPCMEVSSGPPAAADWTEAIADEDARVLLRGEFYRFAAIDWLPFEVAVRRAHQEHKPLHLVLLFGSLDDESC